MSEEIKDSPIGDIGSGSTHDKKQEADPLTQIELPQASATAEYQVMKRRAARREFDNIDEFDDFEGGGLFN